MTLVRKKIATTFVVLMLASLVSLLAEASTTESRAQKAIGSAQRAQKYLFLFCYEQDDAETQRNERVFNEAISEVRNRAQSVRVPIKDPLERGFVVKYGLQGVPAPFVLVLAPNGAVMRGFPPQLNKDKLLNSFGTSSMELSVKALQDGKLVMISVQGQGTRHNAEATQAIKDFQADARFGKRSEFVKVDLDDAGEQLFLDQLGVNGNVSEAITILMAPPAHTVAKLEGEIDKAHIVAAIEKASSGQCCPGGKCCPGSNCNK